MWSAGFTAVFGLLSAAQAQFFYSHFYKAKAAKSGKYGDGTNVCTLGCALLTKNDIIWDFVDTNNQAIFC